MLQPRPERRIALAAIVQTSWLRDAALSFARQLRRESGAYPLSLLPQCWLPAALQAASAAPGDPACHSTAREPEGVPAEALGRRLEGLALREDEPAVASRSAAPERSRRFSFSAAAAAAFSSLKPKLKASS